MLRRCCSSLLLTLTFVMLATMTGCTACQSCDDYCGSYYGGRTGDWVHETGRAGSAYATTTTVSHEEMAEGEMSVGETEDAYYP
jgi:Fe-S-cluster-containing dehydrogenase component